MTPFVLAEDVRRDDDVKVGVCAGVGLLSQRFHKVQNGGVAQKHQRRLLCFSSRSSSHSRKCKAQTGMTCLWDFLRILYFVFNPSCPSVRRPHHYKNSNYAALTCGVLTMLPCFAIRVAISQVVERAQQKLKLDAMIVQQGRLTDNAKKVRSCTVRRVYLYRVAEGGWRVSDCACTLSQLYSNEGTESQGCHKFCRHTSPHTLTPPYNTSRDVANH